MMVRGVRREWLGHECRVAIGGILSRIEKRERTEEREKGRREQLEFSRLSWSSQDIVRISLIAPCVTSVFCVLC